VQQTQNLGDA